MDDLTSSWGVLFLYVASQERHRIVRDHLIAAYEKENLSQISWKNAEELMERTLGTESLGDLQINKQKQLDSDEVFVLEERNSNWVGVLSRRWELAEVGKHPLALILSQVYPVFSLASLEGQYAEYARYESGKVIQISLVGNKIPSNIPTDLPPLDHLWFRGKEANDLTWFKNKDNNAYSGTFQNWLGSPERFIAYLGLSAKGHAAAFEEAPLSDYSPNHYLVFRKKSEAEREY